MRPDGDHELVGGTYQDKMFDLKKSCLIDGRLDRVWQSSDFCQRSLIREWEEKRREGRGEIFRGVRVTLGSASSKLMTKEG